MFLSVGSNIFVIFPVWLKKYRKIWIYQKKCLPLHRPYAVTGSAGVGEG